MVGKSEPVHVAPIEAASFPLFRSPAAGYISSCLRQAAAVGIAWGNTKAPIKADRWRKRMRQGRRWRLSANAVIWTLIVLLMTVSIALIANKVAGPAN